MRLQGQCIVQSEKHFPLILKNAGYNFTEKSGTIQIKEIPIPKEKEKEPFKPKDLFYDVTFVFINTASALDCGLSVDDILFPMAQFAIFLYFRRCVRLPCV